MFLLTEFDVFGAEELDHGVTATFEVSTGIFCFAFNNYIYPANQLDPRSRVFSERRAKNS